MTEVVIVMQALLGAAALLALIRAVRGPDLIDRIVALDLVLLLLAGGLAAQGAVSGTEYFIGAVIAVALVAFAGTVLVARFIEWRDAP